MLGQCLLEGDHFYRPIICHSDKSVRGAVQSFCDRELSIILSPVSVTSNKNEKVSVHCEVISA